MISGKTVIPFATSRRQRYGEDGPFWKAQCPDTVQWRPGRLLNGRLGGESAERVVGQPESVILLQFDFHEGPGAKALTLSLSVFFIL